MYELALFVCFICGIIFGVIVKSLLELGREMEDEEESEYETVMEVFDE